MTTRPDPRVGTELGSYRILSVLGRGGMGVVYLAEHRDLGRKVALKLLAPDFADDEAFRARFLRESRMAAAIDHPNIIPIYEAGEVEGVYFLAMRYVDGADLETRLRAGALAPDEAVRLLGQVASALDAAHVAGLVHRDVKPANLLIASGQGLDRADHVYLTDFGLTKQRGSVTGLTRTGSFLGTLEYIAPEQIEGKPVDGRADQYALAAIAVECLTGQAPYPRDSDVAILNAHLRDAPPALSQRRPELPPTVDRVIARGLAKKAEDRYPDCRTFIEDLRDALGIKATQPRERPLPVTGARRAILAATALVAVIVLVAGWAILGSRSPGVTPSPGATDIAVASGSPTPSLGPTAAGDPTIGPFPNGAEAALLRALPASLAKTCQRGPYDLVRGQSGTTSPLASLSCSPAISSGADAIVVRQFKNSGLGGGFNTEGVISDIETGLKLKPGTCAQSGQAGGRWEIAGQDAGAMACYIESATGDAIVWWSYKADNVLVKAANQRGDPAAVYRAVQQIAPFITP